MISLSSRSRWAIMWDPVSNHNKQKCLWIYISVICYLWASYFLDPITSSQVPTYVFLYLNATSKHFRMKVPYVQCRRSLKIQRIPQEHILFPSSIICLEHKPGFSYSGCYLQTKSQPQMPLLSVCQSCLKFPSLSPFDIAQRLKVFSAVMSLITALPMN